MTAGPAEITEDALRETCDALRQAARDLKQLEFSCRRKARALMSQLDAIYAKYGITVKHSQGGRAND